MICLSSIDEQVVRAIGKIEVLPVGSKEIELMDPTKPSNIHTGWPWLDGYLAPKIKVVVTAETICLVQVGKGKSNYRTQYEYVGKPGQALMCYALISIGNGYKKRLLIDGKVVARERKFS